MDPRRLMRHIIDGVPSRHPTALQGRLLLILLEMPYLAVKSGLWFRSFFRNIGLIYVLNIPFLLLTLGDQSMLIILIVIILTMRKEILRSVYVLICLKFRLRNLWLFLVKTLQ
jgi:hypothetical protein